MKLLGRELLRVVPLCFVVGASIELFMNNTGFYDVALRKEGERRAERSIQEKERLQRIRELQIKFEDGNAKK